MRFIDGIGVYLVGAISVMLTKRNQRLGDLAAGTIVVRHESSRAVRVVSPTRGRVFEETVRRFLECHTDGIDHEFVLVDNNSTDETRERERMTISRIVSRMRA